MIIRNAKNKYEIILSFNYRIIDILLRARMIGKPVT